MQITIIPLQIIIPKIGSFLGLISAYIGGVFYGETGFLVGIIAFMVAVIVGINAKEI